MISTLIVCLTVIFCVVWITLWIKHMVSRNMPLFTYGECVWKDESNTEGAFPVTQPIGFADSDVPEEEQPKDKTDKEIKDAYLKDPITLTASLLRGEVDIDDITN